MTTDVFVRHYLEVADASPVPVLLYNVTMYTGVNLLPDAVATLGDASEHRRHEGIGERHRADCRVHRADARRFLGAGRLGGDVRCTRSVPGATARSSRLPRSCRARCVQSAGAGARRAARRSARAAAPPDAACALGRRRSTACPALKAALELMGFAGGRAAPPLRAGVAAGRRHAARPARSAGRARTRRRSCRPDRVDLAQRDAERAPALTGGLTWPPSLRLPPSFCAACARSRPAPPIPSPAAASSRS